MHTHQQTQGQKAPARDLGLDRVCASLKTMYGSIKSAGSRVEINCQIRCANEHEPGDYFAILHCITNSIVVDRCFNILKHAYA